MRYLLIGALAFAIFAIVACPARVVCWASDGVCDHMADDGIRLRALSGTVWDGRARISYGGEAFGELGWTYRPSGLLDGELLADWQLVDAAFHLSGAAAYDGSTMQLTVAGRIGAQAINRVLGQYEIRLSGDMEVRDAHAVWSDRPAASGSLHWAGGRTWYSLSGVDYDVVMPPLTGNLSTVGDAYVLDVRMDDSQAPVMTARLTRGGTVSVGVTRRFLDLAGNPWPIAGDPDAVVITVEEQLIDAAVGG